MVALPDLHRLQDLEATSTAGPALHLPRPVAPVVDARLVALPGAARIVKLIGAGAGLEVDVVVVLAAVGGLANEGILAKLQPLDQP